MRSFLLIILLIPAALTIKCWIGFDDKVDEGDCKGTVKGSNFCFKASQQMPGGHIHKDCGYGQCEEEGCKNGTTVCCCSTGDYCNGATHYLIVTPLVAAAAAAWLRI